nr:STELLO glycosyltransferase family protein [uncultured Rhodoferax sp.]
MDKFIVITSIFLPTEAIEKFAKLKEWKVIVVGDKKTASDWSYPGVTYLSPKGQQEVANKFSGLLPWNSYTRKNIGYLYAISQGARVIYESDDDNIPLDNWVNEPEFSTDAELLSDASFVNIYSYFTDKKVWPRGIPLRCVLDAETPKASVAKNLKVGVWQFLADEDPDVDAIYRLTNNTPIYFNWRAPLVLDQDACCPFNSQNTYFRKEVFPLLYLPSTVTFRFTDILRGLVAQPILWAAGYHLGFAGATVLQKRNPHDYLKDFESEIPCYLSAEKVVQIAKEAVSPEKSIPVNLLSVYRALSGKGIVSEKELDILNCWLELVAGPKK